MTRSFSAAVLLVLASALAPLTFGGSATVPDAAGATDTVLDRGTDDEVSATDAAESGGRSYWRPLASPDRATARLSRSPDGTLFAGTRD